MRSYQLTFALWRCDDCGAEFSAMAGCQDCGKTPPQHDKHVLARRSIVERVRGLLDEQGHAAPPIDLQTIWQEIRTWVDRLYDCLALVGMGRPAGEAKLTTAMGELARFRASAASTPYRRPLIGLWRELHDMVETLDGFGRANLDALEASTPDGARAHQARAQTLLDAVGSHAARCGAYLDRLGVESKATFLATLADDTAAAFDAAEATSLTDFDARGGNIFSRITGDSECPTGLGVSLMLIAYKLEEGFDDRRFFRDARLAYDFIIRRPMQLDGLIADAEWRAAIDRANQELLSAAVDLFDQVRGSIQTEWFQTRALLRHGSLLAEGVAVPYLATILALLRKDDWRRHHKKDVGALLNEIRHTELADLVMGLDIGVRDADAHRAFDQLPDGIALRSKRTIAGRVVSGEELLDLVLAAAESCLVLHTALLCAMARHGVPVEDMEPASDLVPLDGKVPLLLGATGLRDTAVELRDGELAVSAHGSLSAQQVMSIAAAMTGLVGERADRLRLSIIESDDSRWDAHGPLAPFRRVTGGTGIDKEAAVVECLASWRVRGSPMFDERAVRQWAARRTAQSLRDDPAVAVSTAEVLAKMAKRMGDGRLQSALNAYGRIIRARASRQPALARDQWASDQILKWIQ